MPSPSASATTGPSGGRRRGCLEAARDACRLYASSWRCCCCRAQRTKSLTIFDSVDPEANGARILRWRPRMRMRVSEAWRTCHRRASTAAAHTENRASGCGGQDFFRRVKKFVATLLAFIDPYKDMLALGSLIQRGHYWWAACSIGCLVTPFVLLWVVLNHFCNAELRLKRQAAFKRCFGCPPFLLLLPLCEAYATGRALLGLATHEQECFHKVGLMLQGTFEAFPWTLFQGYIALRQTAPSLRHEEIVNPYFLLLSLPLSAFTVYRARSFLKVYSKMTHEGNMWAFMSNLLLLGEGMAPPSVLEELRTMRFVRIHADLSSLDYRGLMSVAHAVCSSSALQSVVFDSTQMDQSPGALLSLGETTAWKFFMDEMTFNRKLLATIAFTPAVTTVRVKDWGLPGYAQRLQEVKNGETIVYRFQQPCGEELFDGIERDSREAVLAQVEKGDWRDLTKGAKWAASVGHWWSLAAILSSRPALHLREPLLMCAASEGHEACIRLLIACQADPNQDSALYYAATCGQARGVAPLLAARADPCEPRALPPLSGVSWVDNHQIALSLLEARAETDAKCGDGCTPLWWCAFRSAPRVAKVLIEAGADLEAKDAHWGWTPLTTAADTGSVETLQVLLRARANVFAKSKRGKTPLEVLENKADKTASHENAVKVLLAACNESSSAPAAHEKGGAAGAP